MIDKIKAELQKKGLPLFLAYRIKKTVSIESEIEGAISKLVTDTPDETVAIWKEMDNDIVGYTQSESDRAATKAIQTHDEKRKQKEEEEAREKARKKAELEKGEGKTTDDPKYDELTNKINQLTDLVTHTAKQNTQLALKSKITNAVKEAKLPPSYEKYVNIDSEEQLEAKITELSQDYQQTKQEIINSSLSGDDLELGLGGKGEDVDVKNFVKQQQKQEN